VALRCSRHCGGNRQHAAYPVERGWAAPAILWAAIVGESGTAKTPAFKLALRAVRERQRKALKRHADAMRGYEAELLHYEKALAQWNRDKKATDDPPTKPEAPQPNVAS